MEAAPPNEMLGLFVIVAASTVVLVYVFMRMSGVIGRDSRHGRPPPRTPMG